MRTDTKLIKLFKSGDFTIVYWDSEEPTIYKGKWDIHKEFERDEYITMNKSLIDFPQYNMVGYIPDVVKLLVKALGGKVDSI